jgi:hypothetical protein
MKKDVHGKRKTQQEPPKRRYPSAKQEGFTP